MTLTIRSMSLTLSLLIALGACSAPVSYTPEQSAQNAKTPGWTGRTFVIGSNSTIVGDAVATEMQQKWQLDRGR